MQSNDRNRSMDTTLGPREPNTLYDPSHQSRLINRGNLSTVASDNDNHGYWNFNNGQIDQGQGNGSFHNNSTNDFSGNGTNSYAQQAGTGLVLGNQNANVAPLMGYNGQNQGSLNGIQVMGTPPNNPNFNRNEDIRFAQGDTSFGSFNGNPTDNRAYYPKNGGGNGMNNRQDQVNFNQQRNYVPRNESYVNNDHWRGNNRRSNGRGSRGFRGRGRGTRRPQFDPKFDPKFKSEARFDSPWKVPINRKEPVRSVNSKMELTPQKLGASNDESVVYWETQIRIMKTRTWRIHDRFQAQQWTTNMTMALGIKAVAFHMKEKLVDIIKEFLQDQEIVDNETEDCVIETEIETEIEKNLESSLNFLNKRLSE